MEPITNSPNSFPGMMDRLALAEMSKFLISGGMLEAKHQDGQKDFDLVFAFGQEQLPCYENGDFVYAGMTGLFVRNSLNNPQIWMGVGGLDELHQTLEGLSVGKSFFEKFLKSPGVSGSTRSPIDSSLLNNLRPIVSVVSREPDEPLFEADQVVNYSSDDNYLEDHPQD